MLVAFAGLRFELPDGWADITDDLPDRAPPTLARADGVGAIQFSVASVAAGATPAVTPESLRAMFDARPDFSAIDAQTEIWGSVRAVGGAANTSDATLAAWYVSDGRDIALITYVADVDGSVAALEVADAKAIIRSISFSRDQST